MNENKTKKPNLFIVGVARAGTTSWVYYLKQHPEVFMSEEQRPNHFGDYEDENHEYYKSEENYLSLFKEAKNEKYLGEASHLINSLTAPHQIKKFNPDSKIIIILRNPMDVIRSNFDYGFMNLKGFMFMFKELLYCENLKRWIDIFGRKNVHIIIFDDYVIDAKKEYQKVCDFLGINRNFQPDFTKMNPSSVANYPFFMKIIFSVWNKFPFILKTKIKSMIGKNRGKIQNKYRKLDNSREVRTEINHDDKKQLIREFFLNEIEKTEKLIGRKLDMWKN